MIQRGSQQSQSVSQWDEMAHFFFFHRYDSGVVNRKHQSVVRRSYLIYAGAAHIAHHLSGCRNVNYLKEHIHVFGEDIEQEWNLRGQGVQVA